jgi:peptide subunit release factor 1 (eRF1)
VNRETTDAVTVATTASHAELRMFDSLFGPSKERVAELEAEVESLRQRKADLEAQLEAESERRSTAVSERQEAEEQVNRLEDRIAQLEGELDRVEDDTTGPSFRDTEEIRGARTEAVLDRLATFDAGEEGALTAVVDESVPLAVREEFGDHAPLVERAAPCIALTDDAGLVSVAVSPPVLPDPGVNWGRGFALERERFLPTGEFALALVRADLFALGEYEGSERVDFQGFDTDVKSDHSKGGFSQSRFERLRDEQIEEHLDRCRDALEERSAERLYVVGDRKAIEVLGEDATATAAVDASGDPEDAIEKAFRDFWTTRLYRI